MRILSFALTWASMAPASTAVSLRAKERGTSTLTCPSQSISLHRQGHTTLVPTTMFQRRKTSMILREPLLLSFLLAVFIRQEHSPSAFCRAFQNTPTSSNRPRISPYDPSLPRHSAIVTAVAVDDADTATTLLPPIPAISSSTSAAADTSTLRPNPVKLSSVLEKLMDLKIIGKASECDDLLRQFVHRQHQTKQQLSAEASDASSTSRTREKLLPLHFGVAIAAWANHPQPTSPQQAEALWQLMKEHHIQPTEATYNALLKVHLRFLQHHTSSTTTRNNQPLEASEAITFSQQRIEELWNEMQEQTDILPDSYTFSTLLKAKMTTLSSSLRPIDQVEQILHQMEACQITPNVVVMTNIIQAYVQQLSNRGGNGRSPGVILSKVEDIVQTMKQQNMKLDTVAYTCLLDAYAKCSTFSNNNNNNNHHFPNANSIFARALQVWDEMKQQPGVTPNQRTYTCMIDVCAKSTQEPRAAQIAQDLFTELQKQLGSTSGKVVLPSSVVCNAMINCYYQHNLPHQVEALFQDMSTHDTNCEEVESRLTDHSHVVRLHAWSKAGNPCMAWSALNEMIHGESAALSTIHFNAVLSAWLRSGLTKEAPDKALACLEQMKNAVCGNCRPDTISYNILISTLVRYRHPEASSQTMKLLHKMDDVSSQVIPDLTTYCQTLQAQALSENAQCKAWEIVHRLEEQTDEFWMKEQQPMRKKWGFVVRALQSSQLPEREKLVNAVEGLETKAKETRKKQQQRE